MRLNGQGGDQIATEHFAGQPCADPPDNGALPDRARDKAAEAVLPALYIFPHCFGKEQGLSAAPDVSQEFRVARFDNAQQQEILFQGRSACTGIAGHIIPVSPIPAEDLIYGKTTPLPENFYD